MPPSAASDPVFGLPLTFGAPLVLTALLALPVLWWLLRVTPPLPRRTVFPPLRLLRGLQDEEQTPSATPWWLLLLRLLAAALLILALADPLLGRREFADQEPERYARRFAVDERVGRHHVGEQFDRVLVFRQLHERVEGGERAARRRPLFLEGVDGPLHSRQRRDRLEGVAVHECVVLLAESQRRRHEGGIVWHQRHH